MKNILKLFGFLRWTDTSYLGHSQTSIFIVFCPLTSEPRQFNLPFVFYCFIPFGCLFLKYINGYLSDKLPQHHKFRPAVELKEENISTSKKCDTIFMPSSRFVDTLFLHLISFLFFSSPFRNCFSHFPARLAFISSPTMATAIFTAFGFVCLLPLFPPLHSVILSFFAERVINTTTVHVHHADT